MDYLKHPAFRFKENEIIIRSIYDELYPNVNENGENRLANCNREWITLTKGNNSFKILGKSEVKIDCQFPIRM